MARWFRAARVRPIGRWGSGPDVQFHLVHDLGAPLASVEAALASPRLGALLVARQPRLVSVEQTEMSRRGETLTRVLHVRGRAPLFVPSRALPPAALEWDERFVYDLRRHEAVFEALPAPVYRRWVTCTAAWRLESTGARTCRRSVAGRIDVRAGWMSVMLSRFATSEVRTTYDAEAVVLEELALDAQPLAP